MKANRLPGKVAIVTGGGTGIGEAVCKKFAAPEDVRQEPAPELALQHEHDGKTDRRH